MKFSPSLQAGDPAPHQVWPNPPSDTEETLRAVRRIVRALALSSRDLARRHGLTPAQLLCLRLLKDGGALPAGALASALSLSPQTVTGLIDRLEARDLATRVRSATDRRQVLVSLTRHGLETATAASPSLQERFVTRFDALTPARRRALRRAIEAIVTLLEADALDAAPLLAHDNALNPRGEKTESHAPTSADGEARIPHSHYGA